MKLIVGLGNPDEKYEGTRHNMGFEVIDLLADKLDISVTKREKMAFTGTGFYQGEKVMLVKPQTYMNNSGESVGPLMSYYDIPEEDLLVIIDDVSLKPGGLRVRASGSEGGHNGLKSITQHLGGSRNYARLRVGVGIAAPGKLISHVLGRPDAKDRKAIDEAERVAVDAALTFVTEGVEAAMNKYNGLKIVEETDNV